jgi:beta-glucosidase
MSPARPRRGRAHETYCKNPYLLSALGLAYVRGLQIDDATTAWPPPPSSSWGIQRLRAASTQPLPIWVRTSFTTYAPPFEAAVGDGGLQSVIDSYSARRRYPRRCITRDTDRFVRRTRFSGVVVSDERSGPRQRRKTRSDSGQLRAAVSRIEAVP